MSRPIWVEPAIAAHAAEVQVRTIAKWARLGLIAERNGEGKYDLTSIFDYYESRAAGTEATAAANRARRGERRS